jgi:hypothetical protein
MNPETGQMERIMGVTSDDMRVFESHHIKLRFTPISCAKESSNRIFELGIEWQTNENGARRPYAYLAIGSWVIQSGWLFG